MCPAHCSAAPAISEADAFPSHATHGFLWPTSYIIAEVVQGFAWVALRQAKGRSLEDAFERTYHTVGYTMAGLFEPVDIVSYTTPPPYGQEPSPFSAAKTKWEALPPAKRKEISLSPAFYTRRWYDLDRL